MRYALSITSAAWKYTHVHTHNTHKETGVHYVWLAEELESREREEAMPHQSASVC